MHIRISIQICPHDFPQKPKLFLECHKCNITLTFLTVCSSVSPTASPVRTAWREISTPVSVPALALTSTAWPWESASSPLFPSQSVTSAGPSLTRMVHPPRFLSPFAPSFLPSRSTCQTLTDTRAHALHKQRHVKARELSTRWS